MKVIFSNVYSQNNSEFTSLVSIVPPLDLLYAASEVRNECDNIHVEVIDSNAERLSLSKHIRKIVDATPEFIIFSAKTYEMESVLKLSKELKKSIPSIIVIVSGSHVSALPKETLKNYEVIDFVFVGEIDSIVVDFFNEYSEIHVDYNTEGLGYRRDGEIVINEVSYVENLDSLSLPARDLLDNSLYSSTLASKNTAIQATRGCFGKCYYCDVKNCYGSKVRVRKAIDVAIEMEECYRQHGVSFFSFIDHLFSYDKDFVRELCDEIIDRNLNRKINWICNSRVDTLSRNELQLMKRAGCVMIGIGIEVGDDSALKKIGKNTTTLDVRNFIADMRSVGILSMGYAIMGFPFEDKRDLEKTRNALIAFDPDFVQVSVATPLPGSELYSECVNKGLLLNSDWSDFRFLNKSIIKNTNFSDEYLMNYQRDTVKKFYFRFSKVLRLTYFLIFRSSVNYWSCLKSFFKIFLKLK